MVKKSILEIIYLIYTIWEINTKDAVKNIYGGIGKEVLDIRKCQK